MIIGGLVGAAVETESADHQDEIHHCINCCTTHHEVMTPNPLSALIRRISLARNAVAPETLVSQPVIRKSDPPPKLFA